MLLSFGTLYTSYAAQLFPHGLPTPLARVCQRELSHYRQPAEHPPWAVGNPKPSPQSLLDNGSTYLPGVLPWFPSPPSGAPMQERGYRVTVPCRSFHGLRLLLGCLLIRFRHISTKTVLGIPANQSYYIIDAGFACLTSFAAREEGWLPLLCICSRRQIATCQNASLWSFRSAVGY
jgi:hypothetical protein